METYEKIATLTGHTDSVGSLNIHENNLYSVSKNGTVNVWII